jgi:Phage integrase family
MWVISLSAAAFLACPPGHTAPVQGPAVVGDQDVVWRPAFDVAGITYEPDRSDGTHALRHLFASSMLARSVSIKELAAFLGHSSEAFTLRTYAHLLPNSYERARLAVDEMFKPRKGTPEQSSEGNTA